MGQVDVLVWLCNRRLSTDNNYYSPVELERCMRQDNIISTKVAFKCAQLYKFGYLERRVRSMMFPSYRARKSVADSVDKWR